MTDLSFFERTLAAAAILVAAALAPQVAAAQNAAPRLAEAPWLKECRDINDRTVCTTRKQVNAVTGPLIVAAELTKFKDAPEINLAVRVPPGMLLKPGMKAQVDEGVTVNLAYDYCVPDFCVANLKVGDDFVNAMKAGGELGITTQTVAQQGQVIRLPISLIGFTAAYDGEGLDEAGVQSRMQELGKILSTYKGEQNQRLIDAQRAN